MALSFYRQREIDEMDANNIPKDFLNYFKTLDHEAQLNLVGTRPDLAAVLGIIIDTFGELRNQQDKKEFCRAGFSFQPKISFLK